MVITGRRVNLVEGRKELGAELGQDGSSHLLTDPQPDHVHRVEQLVRQQLTLLPAAGEDDPGIRDQVEHCDQKVSDSISKAITSGLTEFPRNKKPLFDQIFVLEIGGVTVCAVVQ